MAEIEDLDSELFPLGSSPLHIVAKSGDIKSLKLLLHSSSIKSRIDLLDHHRRTPLAVALQNGRFDAAEVLVKSGASLEVSFDDVQKLPISQILASAYFCPFLETLIRNGVHISLNPSLLVHLIHSAAYDGRSEFLRTFLECYKTDVNAIDNLGQTALHYASLRNKYDCVKVLLNFGANVLLANPRGSTALHLACIGGYQNVVTLHLQHIADVSKIVDVQDSLGRTPLHIALYYRKLELFNYFMSNYRSCLNIALFDNFGYTIPALLFMMRVDSRFPMEYRKYPHLISPEEASWLLFEGVTQNNLELVKHSISSGAVIECMDYMQQTPILLSSKVGGFDIFKTLIVAGADPNVCDHGGKCTLQYACELDNINIAVYLISLEKFDLSLFFDRYNGPLTVTLLSALIDYIDTHPLRRPKNWRKWLALACRNRSISVSLFSKLVVMISPHNWVEHLACQEECCDNNISQSQSTQCFPTRTLPILTDGDNKDEVASRAYYEELRSKRMPLKKRKQYANKVGGQFACMMQREPAKIFTWYKPKQFPLSMYSNSQNMPFQFHFKRKFTAKYYPVHEAALCGNSDVLEYMLLSVRDSSVSLLKRLIEKTDDCGQTLAEIIARKYKIFKEMVAKLDINKVVFDTVNDLWPLNFNYLESLLHYILSEAKIQAVGRKFTVTPLDRWPQWMFKYMIQINHCSEEELAMAEKGKKREIFLCLLNKGVKSMDINESKGYPPLLFAAVICNNELAVRALLESGASPTVKFHGRYAITAAARNCNTAIIEHFLCIGCASLLSYIHKFNDFTHDLLSGLCSLANLGFVETVERVIVILDLFPNSHSLWQSDRSLRLIYILIESRTCNSLKLGDALAFDLASFLIKSKLKTRSIDNPLLYDTQRAMKIMKKILSFSHVFSRCDSTNIRLLVKLARFYNNLHTDYHEYAFHFLCGWGKIDLINHFLTCLNSSYYPELFRHLNSHQQSPLYYAACGGHLEVIKLLLDKGCECYYPNENPPFKGALVYLAHTRPPKYKEQLLKLKCPLFSFRNQLATCHGNSKSPVGYSYCHSYSTSLSSVSMKQLVNSLLPLTEEIERILHNAVHASDILCLIAFQNNLNILHRLLHILSDILEKASPSYLTLSNTFLDEAVTIMPYHCPDFNESFILLDNIFAKLPTHTGLCLSTLATAAQKCLWRLVKQGFQSPLQYPDNRSFLSILCKVMAAGARHGRFDIVALVYNVCLHGNEIPIRCYIPLLQAFQYNHLDLLSFIEPKNGPSFLLEAVKLNFISVLKAVFNFLFLTDPCVVGKFDGLIRSCCSTNCLNILHEYYMKSSISMDTRLEDSNRDFWLKVLSLQSLKGNTLLALKAVDSLSDGQLQYFSKQPEFRTILGNCCYWGMKDVLGCLIFETSQLLEPCSRSEPLSPWEIALAVGHTGKLSQVENFPCMSLALESIPHNSQVHVCTLDDNHKDDETLAEHTVCIAPLLFLGVIHKLLSLPTGFCVTTSENKSYLPFRKKSVKCFLDIFDFAIRQGKFSIVKVCLEHIGSYAGYLIDKMFSFVYHACERKDNHKILELLLRHLNHVGALNAHLDKTHNSLLAHVISLGSVSSAKVIVELLPCDTLKYQLQYHYHLRGTLDSNSLLHLAVLSKSTKAVDYILELLGRDAPKFCFDKNYYAHSPVTLAFALGYTHIICCSRLITEASKMFSECEKHIFTWTEYGWFSHLMELNTPAISVNVNVESEGTVIGSPKTTVCDFRLVCILRLLTKAVWESRESVISRLMFMVKKLELMLKVFLNLDPQVLNILFAEGYLSDISLEMPQSFLLNIITGCGREDLLLKLLRQDCIARAGLLKETFLFGCELNKSIVINNILQERNAHSLFEDGNLIKRGLAHAVACGSFETASLIMLECGEHMDYKYLPPGVQLSEVVETIFTCSNYYQLVNKFYLSVAKCNSNRSRIPISVAWLVHGWTETEAEVVLRHLGRGSPLNPWSVVIQSQTCSQEVSVSIDWESFSECLTTVYKTKESSKFRYMPLLVEATVFSPSVLGQICQASSTLQSVNIFSFYSAANLTALILSSVLWPEKPSFSSLYQGQGILTLSFMPSEGVFLFPSPTSTSCSAIIEDYNPDTNACSHVSAGLNDSLRKTDQFIDIAHFTVNTIEKVCKRLNVSIIFSDEIMDIDDVNMFRQTYEKVRVTLDDFVQVFTLVHNRRISFCSSSLNFDVVQHRKIPCPVSLSHPFKKLDIQFDFSSKYISSLEKKSLLMSTTCQILSVRFILSREGETDGVDTCSEFYSQLLETLVTHLTIAQSQYEREKLEKCVDTVVTRNFKSNLRFNNWLGLDFISLFYEDRTGHKLKLCAIDTTQSICINLFKELKRFLILFSKSLQVFSYQPKLQAKIRQMFEPGFRVILSEKQHTSLTLKGCVPHMVVNTQQVCEGMPRSIFVEVIESLVKSVQSQNLFERNIPSIVMSYIDYENSSGLLYPTINKNGKIIIRLIDHKSKIISSIPIINCVLDVCISSPDGSQIKACTSFHETVPKRESRHIVLNATHDGQFVVEWTPVKCGVHCVYMLVNGIPVKGSPFKSHTLLPKETCHTQASPGESITFVVSHNFNIGRHGCPNCIPPVVLYKRRAIKDTNAVSLIGCKHSPSLSPSCIPEASKQFHGLSAKDCGAVHHISICSRYGGPRHWFHIPVENVVVYISPHLSCRLQCTQSVIKRNHQQNKFTVKCYLMNNDFTRIAITCTCKFGGVYKMFVACSKCQSVMDVLWLDGKTSLPSLLKFTSTRFET